MLEADIHILLVADQLAPIERIKQAFQQVSPGCRISSAQTLARARAALQAERFDLLIVELYLSDGKGTELLGQGAGTRPSHPVIVLTDGEDEKGTRSAIKAGALDCMVKSEEALSTMPFAARHALQEWRHMHEKEQLELELRHAQKMESIGTLAGGVAHDVNNLLTAIAGYAELAAESLGNVHPAQESLEMVRRATAQAVGVTRSLLTFSRKVSTSKPPIELCDLVRETMRLLRRFFPGAIELEEEVPAATEIWIEGDRTQIQQVLMNLAINARDAMTSGGTLEVSLRKQEATGQDEEDLGQVELRVADNGVGMSEEVKGRIFEPFFTTKARGRGTGLGLSVVRGITRDHRGTIEMESKEGQGSIFRVRLPLCATPVQRKRPNLRSIKHRGQGELILVAEDNQQVRALIEDSLIRFGYSVRAAANGEAALEAFRMASDVRLLVLDLDLPRRSGESCLLEIRETSPRVPAILISGNVDQLTEPTRFLRTRVLAKPFRVSDLLSIIREMLAGNPTHGSSASELSGQE